LEVRGVDLEHFAVYLRGARRVAERRLVERRDAQLRVRDLGRIGERGNLPCENVDELFVLSLRAV
jgi:hypothetical protein